MQSQIFRTSEIDKKSKITFNTPYTTLQSRHRSTSLILSHVTEQDSVSRSSKDLNFFSVQGTDGYGRGIIVLHPSIREKYQRYKFCPGSEYENVFLLILLDCPKVINEQISTRPSILLRLYKGKTFTHNQLPLWGKFFLYRKRR